MSRRACRTPTPHLRVRLSPAQVPPHPPRTHASTSSSSKATKIRPSRHGRIPSTCAGHVRRLPPSRVHRTRPLLSPRDLPSSSPPRPCLVPPPGARCLTMWRLDMPSHYSPTCRGCVFPIGWNTSSATSLIVGLTAAAPNRPAPGAVPGGNALVTTAMH